MVPFNRTSGTIAPPADIPVRDGGSAIRSGGLEVGAAQSACDRTGAEHRLSDPDASAALAAGRYPVVVAGPAAPAVAELGVPVGDERLVQAAHLGAVQHRRRVWHGGLAPADVASLGHGQAELLGECPVTGVVEPALTAGVLDLAGTGDTVSGLVQQGPEHIAGTPL